MSTSASGRRLESMVEMTASDACSETKQLDAVERQERIDELRGDLTSYVYDSDDEIIDRAVWQMWILKKLKIPVAGLISAELKTQNSNALMVPK